MTQIQITRKQHDDISAFYELIKSDTGVIEGFFLKSDGQKITGYFNDKQAFIQSVTAYNHHGFTCYAGIQPRKAALLKSDRSASGDDVPAMRIMAVDLDACKPRDKAGNKLKVNATDAEKLACLTAARNISTALTNGNMTYQEPVLMDSGSGSWLFMRIPEIEINDSNRREIMTRLKTWGRRFKERFQREGIEIDESIFELHRLTKIPGTKVFSYPDEPDRPQRISAFLSNAAPQPDEKLRQDFLTMPVEVPLERKTTSIPVGESYRNTARIFERCFLMKFLADKGSSGVSMPHNVRLALSTFSLSLNDLDNNLDFIRRILEGCPDFSESKTRRYLELNHDKSAPYGCDALRDLVKQHFKDFDASKCQCNLPVSRDHSGNPRKPSPIRFAGILPEDLSELFSSLELSGDSFQDFLQMRQFATNTLAGVDRETARTFLEAQDLKKQTVNDLLKARKEATPQDDATQAQRLIKKAEEDELFHTPEKDAYSTFKVGDHYETWPTKVKAYRNYLRHKFYQETGKTPSSQGLQDALGEIDAKCQYDGKEHSVFIRVATKGESIYIDMVNDQWDVIEITATGWQVTQNPPVKFRRTKGMTALPYPVKGSLESLNKYLNLANPEDFKLACGWLIATLKPSGPYPVFVLTGEQGSAKSTAVKILKALIDPATSPLRTTPTEIRDLMIAANNSWLLCFDNLSHLPVWASDAICRLSTGGGFSTRTLYADDEETIFNATRGVILNGIEDIVTRHDLADRSIIVNLKPIPEDQRIPEKDLWSDFEDDKPGILGALLDAVSCALRNIETTKLDRLPRMADFALWVTAAEPALPWKQGEFMNQYQKNVKEVVELSLDADVLASAVRSLVEDRPEGWEGNATDLLNLLDDRADDKTKRQKHWPKAAHILTGRLKRSATALRTSGIEIGVSRKSYGKRTISIVKRDASEVGVIEASHEASRIEKDDIQLYSDVKGSRDACDACDASSPSFSSTSDFHPKSQEMDVAVTTYQKEGRQYSRVTL